MKSWGSPSAADQKPPAFDPATAFEGGSTDAAGDSDSNRSDDAWQDKQPLAAPQKRQRLDDSAKPRAADPAMSEVAAAESEASLHHPHREPQPTMSLTLPLARLSIELQSSPCHHYHHV